MYYTFRPQCYFSLCCCAPSHGLGWGVPWTYKRCDLVQSTMWTHTHTMQFKGVSNQFQNNYLAKGCFDTWHMCFDTSVACRYMWGHWWNFSKLYGKGYQAAFYRSLESHMVQWCVHAVLRVLLPSLHCELRRNLRNLVDTTTDDETNYPRRFWTWLKRQPWRRMLPEPFEQLSIRCAFSCFGLHLCFPFFASG